MPLRNVEQLLPKARSVPAHWDSFRPNDTPHSQDYRMIVVEDRCPGSLPPLGILSTQGRTCSRGMPLRPHCNATADHSVFFGASPGNPKARFCNLPHYNVVPLSKLRTRSAVAVRLEPPWQH